MERIKISKLVVGSELPGHLFSLSGQKLLNAGVIVNQRHLDAMRHFGDADVVLARSVEELVEAGIIERFDSSRLTVGQKAPRGLLTPTGQMVVDADEVVEEHHLDALRATGGAFSSRAGGHEQSRDRMLVADALAEEVVQQTRELPLRVQPDPHAVPPTTASAEPWPDPIELGHRRNQAVERLRQLLAQIEAGIAMDAGRFDGLLDDLMRALFSHPTRFTQLALLCPRQEDYLPDHAYTTAVLAMATAAQLRWHRDDIRRLGLAALLSDLGMLLIPERIRTSGNQLSDEDRGRVRRHPLFTVAMLQTVQGLPPIVKLAALEHHERENGMGYARGLRRDHICDYARVLGVADSYAATTEPRHHRRPKLPYIAMEELVRSASSLQFWKPAARALVQAAGLFPVGSYVKLSDGGNAHVVAANFQRLDRPTVQPLNPAGYASGRAIDLATVEVDRLNVVRPIAGPMAG